MKNNKGNNTSSHFPPVVAVLGHVDHGKTTLLDAIRKTSIAQKEVGGITQRIGASSVEILHDGKKRRITLIDTPGHQAFSKMRGRGTQAADIGLLVIASVDGIKPQTEESIRLLLQSNIPFIVVFTKSDLPQRSIATIKQQLMREKVTLDEFGGETPAIEVSAKTGKNIKELLELILLVYDLSKPQVPRDEAFSGIIIESRLDHTIGPVATVVVKKGILTVGDVIFAEKNKCKVRSIINDRGERLNQIGAGEAIEVLGFDNVPAVGSIVLADELHAQKNQTTVTAPSQPAVLYSLTAQKNTLSIILCADTAGSLEAVKHALPKGIGVILEKTGEITESDVLFAKSAGAILIGFQARVRSDVLSLAISEKILLKNYSLIYELLTELGDAVEGKRLAQEEQVYGTAKVLAKFPFEKTFVLGIRVLQGRVSRGDRVRLMRGDITTGEATITSLRVGKQNISKVEAGHEAGIILSHPLDFIAGDMIICHS